MSKGHQYREIQHFLKGKYRKEIDAFDIYQWIDRCYFHAWWDLAVKLSSSIPPNSLNQEYHKRLEYLLGECRSRSVDQFAEVKNPKATRVFSVPREFRDICERLDLKPGGSSNSHLRLEYLGEKVIQIETISTDKCTFYFYDMDAVKLAEWLGKNGFEHLVQNIKSKNDTRRQRARLRISWEDASNMIPVLHEGVKKYLAFIDVIRGAPPEAREKIREILKGAGVIDY